MVELGEVIDGRYELVRDIGRGAAGRVFEARHTFTHRSVALKIVAPDVPPSLLENTRARLVREARAIAAVRHPGVVDVLDGGHLPDGTPYVVLERLEGRTLEGLIAARGKLAPLDAVAVGIQLCDALDACHARSIVHRDIKPSNVIIVRDSAGQERAKLVDFGIAQVAMDKPAEKLTGLGALIGTPEYMSPEQLLGVDVDLRSDLYALGMTLFECLTGEPPYRGSYQQILLRVCGPEDAPPSLGSAAEDVPAALAEVVTRALERKPGARFGSAIEMMRALHASMPGARLTTTFLGPPPPPRFSPAAPAGADHRKAPRAGYVTPISLVVGDRTLDGRSEDISESGLLVLVDHVVDAGASGSVRFAVPLEGHVVSAKVKVRWARAARGLSRNTAIGLEFDGLEKQAAESIRKYVALMSEGTRTAS